MNKRSLIQLPPPPNGRQCCTCGKFIRYNAEQGMWAHLDAERHVAVPPVGSPTENTPEKEQQ